MDTMEEIIPAVKTSRRPPGKLRCPQNGKSYIRLCSFIQNLNLWLFAGDSFRQQRMSSWNPVMTPLKIIVIFFAVGICFIPTGTSVLKSSNAVSFITRTRMKLKQKYEIETQIIAINNCIASQSVPPII